MILLSEIDSSAMMLLAVVVDTIFDRRTEASAEKDSEFAIDMVESKLS